MGPAKSSPTSRRSASSRVLRRASPPRLSSRIPRPGARFIRWSGFSRVHEGLGVSTPSLSLARIDLPHQLERRMLAPDQPRLQVVQGHPLRRTFPRLLQFALCFYREQRDCAGHICRAVIPLLKRQICNTKPRFLVDFAAQRAFLSLTPSCNSSWQRETSSVISKDGQKFAFAIDDCDRGPQRSEDGKGPIEGKAGASNDPKQAAFRSFQQSPQASSLACRSTLSSRPERSEATG